MNRYIFHVPVQQILICAIYANTEREAWRQLEAGVCEHLYHKTGTTKSGKTELKLVQRNADRRRKNE